MPAYVRALASRRLWLAAAELPPGLVPGGEVVLETAVELPLLGSPLPEGHGRGLLVFTDESGVRARDPRAFPLAMSGDGVLRLAVSHHDGVVVDPHARWQVLANDWIAAALG